MDTVSNISFSWKRCICQIPVTLDCLPKADTTNNFEACFVSEDWQFHPHQPMSHNDCSPCIAQWDTLLSNYVYALSESTFCDL